MNEAFTQAVDATGYVVPTALLDRNMIPYFYDENGVYSKKLFNEASDSTKIELRNSLENSLVYQRYTEDLFGSTSDKIGDYAMYGLKTPSKEAAFINSMGPPGHLCPADRGRADGEPGASHRC